MLVTEHAGDRMKERCGLPKKAIERAAERALTDGIMHKECKGRLKKYVDYLFLSHMQGNNIRIYGDYVYIFDTGNLITVFSLPRIYRKAVQKIVKKRK